MEINNGDLPFYDQLYYGELEQFTRTEEVTVNNEPKEEAPVIDSPMREVMGGQIMGDGGHG